ncbi:MAG: hypothetical protein R6U04_03190 [Bacteroidales bacterium]
MKKLVFLIILFALSSEGISQQLLIVCEPGYRVYLDDTLKGVTSDAQDGLLIEGLAVGRREITVKKRSGFMKVFFVDIKEGLNELIVEIDKSAGFPLKDGYYVTRFAIREEHALFNSVKKHDYLILYMGADDPSTEIVEFDWTSYARFEDESRTVYTMKDLYYGLFLDVYNIPDLRRKRHSYLYSGEMKLTASGYVSLRMIIPPQIGVSNGSVIIGNGQIDENGKDFTLYLRGTKGPDRNFDKDFTFKFVSMPSRPAK